MLAPPPNIAAMHLSPRLAAWLDTPAARHGLRLGLALALAAVGTLALIPSPPRALDLGWDKSNHTAAFAVLALLAIGAFWRAPRRDAACGLGLLAYGGLIELLQTQVPGRTGEWLDLLADGVGIALALLVARLFRR